MNIYNIQAEQVVLGAMLNDSKALEDGITQLEERDFGSKEHKLIFSSLKELKEKGAKDIGILKISMHLKDLGVLDKSEGAKYLTDLSMMVGISTDVDHYAELIKESTVKRTIRENSLSVIDELARLERPLEEIVIDYQKKAFDIALPQTKKLPTALEFYDDFPFGMNQDSYYRFVAQERRAGRKVIFGLSTGFDQLDDYTGGLVNGNLILIGARTSVGKTTFTLNVINSTLKANPDAKIGFFSLEMKNRDIYDRLVAIEAGIDYKRLLDGMVSDEELDQLPLARERLPLKNMILEPNKNLKISRVIAICQKMVKVYGVKAIFIDFLTLIKPDSSLNNAHQDYGTIAKTLQQLALDLSIPIVCLAQLNRASTNRENKAPTLADFRESGAIEEAGDICLLLHRNNYYDPSNEDKKLQVMCLKNRIRGSIGKIFYEYENGSYKEVEGGEDNPFIKTEPKISNKSLMDIF